MIFENPVPKQQKRHPHIAIAYKEDPKKVILWCHYSHKQNGNLVYRVINGAWDIILDTDGNVLPPYEYSVVVWQGTAKFAERSYDEAIDWLNDQISDSPTFENPSLTKEEEQKIADELSSEIPF